MKIFPIMLIVLSVFSISTFAYIYDIRNLDAGEEKCISICNNTCEDRYMNYITSSIYDKTGDISTDRGCRCECKQKIADLKNDFGFDFMSFLIFTITLFLIFKYYNFKSPNLNYKNSIINSFILTFTLFLLTSFFYLHSFLQLVVFFILTYITNFFVQKLGNKVTLKHSLFLTIILYFYLKVFFIPILTIGVFFLKDLIHKIKNKDL